MNKNKLVQLLKEQNIKYKLYNHSALFTVKDSIKLRGSIVGAHTKNLFLKNKKNEFFLISCLETTKVDLKKLKTSLNFGNISFAKDHYLKNILKLYPGSVTPYGLINDVNNIVKYYFDSALLNYKIINFHPLTNTSTVSLSTIDFLNFMKAKNKLVNILNFDNYTIT